MIATFFHVDRDALCWLYTFRSFLGLWVGVIIFFQYDHTIGRYNLKTASARALFVFIIPLYLPGKGIVWLGQYCLKKMNNE